MPEQSSVQLQLFQYWQNFSLVAGFQQQTLILTFPVQSRRFVFLTKRSSPVDDINSPSSVTIRPSLNKVWLKTSPLCFLITSISELRFECFPLSGYNWSTSCDVLLVHLITLINSWQENSPKRALRSSNNGKTLHAGKLFQILLELLQAFDGKLLIVFFFYQSRNDRFIPSLTIVNSAFSFGIWMGTLYHFIRRQKVLTTLLLRENWKKITWKCFLPYSQIIDRKSVV